MVFLISNPEKGAKSVHLNEKGDVTSNISGEIIIPSEEKLCLDLGKGKYSCREKPIDLPEEEEEPTSLIELEELKDD